MERGRQTNETYAARHIIEADRTGQWYEEALEMRHRDTVANILEHAPGILDYCQKFDVEIMAAVNRGMWVAVPLQRGVGQDPTRLARVRELVENAEEIVIFDSGNPEYTDTTQLGMDDSWFPHGQVHYDVDATGVEVTNVFRARDRVLFEDAGAVTLNGLQVLSDDWDYTGPQDQVVRL